ncbi:probable serine/threonine-protein kinase PBL18 [Triticum dicoccoides]|uniref:Uncharacterized protein n=1 Tax=Triticum urartu TaxID=4572 RepID=A0A8R7P501_TRIUA|nr:probable serine/threonine-protein kinase PBL18 [Triticum dicoccoides]XP_044460212.1 probable serine/threonine-protein kinase PBL18 [Triticum aestivum]
MKNWIGSSSRHVRPRPAAGVPLSAVCDSFTRYLFYLQEEARVGKRWHRRLANLIGYCCDGVERLFVAEFMPNDTLAKHLFHYPTMSPACSPSPAPGSPTGSFAPPSTSKFKQLKDKKFKRSVPL